MRSGTRFLSTAVILLSGLILAILMFGGIWLYRSTPVSRSILRANSIEEVIQITLSPTSIDSISAEIEIVAPIIQSRWTRSLLSIVVPSVVLNDLEFLLENEKVLIGLLREFHYTVGSKEQSRVRVLLQNDMEIRPTGGFLGSYADLVFDQGVLVDVIVQDIYEPDGQVVGYIKPPEPVEQYLFQSGGWKLRDANWDPDFARSAEAIDWFFQKAEYPEAEMMLGITLGLMEEIFEILAPVYLPDYGLELDAEQMYVFIQRETEHEFFPGATNKRDVISAVARAMIRQFSELDTSEKLRIMTIVLDGVQSRELQAWSPIETSQQNLELLGVNGGFFSNLCQTDTFCLSDYIYLVEANLGINKTNCCIERHVSIRYKFEDSGEVSRRLSIQYNNKNPKTPNPPKQYGGGYLNYLRLYTNNAWICKSVTIQDQSSTPNRGCNSIGSIEASLQERSFSLLIEGGENGEIVVEEVLPFHWKNLNTFAVGLQRQSGTRTNTYVIELDHPSEYQFSIQDEQYLHPVTIDLLKPTTLTFTYQTR